MIFQLALKELWGSRRSLSLPFLALSLAIASLYVLSALQFRVDQLLLSEGRESLGGDLQIRSVLPIGEDKIDRVREALPSDSRFAGVTNFNTMLRMPNTSESRFVRARMVDSSYPLYGEYELNPVQDFSQLDSEEPSIFIPQDVADVFDLELGDRVRVGELSFRVSGLIQKRPGALAAALRFAPSVYFHQKFLPGTQLISSPGRVDYEVLVALPRAALTGSVELVEKALEDNTFEVSAYDSSDRGLNELIGRFRLFGQIVGLAGLLIAVFAIYGSFQTWFRERRYLVALLRVSGASSTQIRMWMGSSVLSLAFLASVLGIFLGVLGERSIAPVLQQLIDFSTEDNLPWSLALGGLILGVGMTTIFSLIAMAEVKNFKPILLIRPQLEKLNLARVKWGLGAAIGFVLFLWIWRSTGNLNFSMALSLGLVGALILSVVFSLGLFALLKTLGRNWGLIWTYTTRGVNREWRSAVTNSSLLFLITCLLSFVLCLERAFLVEFEIDDEKPMNTFFVFDAGDEEKAEVDEFLASFPGYQVYWLPSLTLRWKAWNGRDPYENLSRNFFDQELRSFVVEDLPEDNRVVAGQWWEDRYSGTGPVEMSLTQNYAFRRGIRLGDQMTLELYGVEFEAVVTSFRNVRFLNFRPNSRFLFQAGFFDGLPFNWYGAIETPALDQSSIRPESFIREFAQRFQTLSFIDLSEVRADIVDYIEKLRWAVLFILCFLMLISTALIAAMAREKLESRRKEVTILKSFGASRHQILKIVGLEFSLVSLLPALAGSALGFFAAFYVLVYFFNIFYLPFSLWVLGIPVLAWVLVLVVGLLACRRLFKLKPRELLAEQAA